MRLRKPRALSFASAAAERYALSAYTSADVLALFRSPPNFRLSCTLASVNLVVTDQLVLGIRIHVVLVAVEALTVLLGPARILVFLPVFRGVLLPFFWCLAGLHGLILFAAITLLGNRHNRGINHRSEEHTSELQSPCNL